MTITEFGRALRAGKTTSEQATEQCLANIEASDRRLNAFILVMADEALRRARDADRELAGGRDLGPLHGVPISIKDLMDVHGTPTTAASRVRTARPAAADAPAIANLRAAGAVFVGKTNLHEYALGTTSEDSAFGAVRNPIDPGRSPGGSSGGSAVSVAADMAFASVGTDTGGSIRIPASACGVVGLKPSYGEVSTDGVIALSPRLDHVGPLTKSVADAWTMFRALAGELRPAPLKPSPASTVRLLVLRKYFCEFLDDDVRERFEEALRRFSAAGMRVDESVIEHADTIVSVYQRIAPREAFLQHAATLDTVPDRYTAPVRQRLEVGRTVSLEDFTRALDDREVLRADVDAALAAGDALVLPTLPIPAPRLGADMVPVGATEQPTRAMMLRDTQLFNLTGHPAISLPCGLTRDGLPCGLQLVGPIGQTDALIRVALTCESLLQRASAAL
jgi:aspartyl-tRNA(Asn)/glutamyl-tRNA(Gln) amidotransferase subunit A